MKKRLKIIIIIILIISSGILYYNLAGNVTNQTLEIKILRAVDGDTFEFEYGKVRLLGINTPEQNEQGYEEAKEFLKKYENKIIRIEIYNTDMYGRFLAYAFSDDLINKMILEKGLASLYYYDKDKYYNQMQKSEEIARNNNLGIWKESENKNCIELVEFKHTEPEFLKLKNNCDFNLNLTIKDDATHIYHEVIKKNSNLQMNFSHIFNDAGDTLFVWDDSGLVLWERY